LPTKARPRKVEKRGKIKRCEAGQERKETVKVFALLVWVGRGEKQSKGGEKERGKKKHRGLGKKGFFTNWNPKTIVQPPFRLPRRRAGTSLCRGGKRP